MPGVTVVSEQSRSIMAETRVKSDEESLQELTDGLQGLQNAMSDLSTQVATTGQAFKDMLSSQDRLGQQLIAQQEEVLSMVMKLVQSQSSTGVPQPVIADPGRKSVSPGFHPSLRINSPIPVAETASNLQQLAESGQKQQQAMGDSSLSSSSAPVAVAESGLRAAIFGEHCQKQPVHSAPFLPLFTTYASLTSGRKGSAIGITDFTPEQLPILLDPDEVLVRFEAQPEDGTLVAKSDGVEFAIREGYFCPALSEAVKTRKKGEKVLLTVKPQYGFGDDGKPASEIDGAVPPNATIQITLEWVSWKTGWKTGSEVLIPFSQSWNHIETGSVDKEPTQSSRKSDQSIVPATKGNLPTTTLIQSPVKTPPPGRVLPVKPLKPPKPMAKDPNKRDMSLEEKLQLGIGLQSWPPENNCYFGLVVTLIFVFYWGLDFIILIINMVLLVLSFILCFVTLSEEVSRPDVVKVGAIITFGTINGEVSKIALKAAENYVNSDPNILGGSKLSITMYNSNFSGFLGIIGALTTDRNGHHVIQYCLKHFSAGDNMFILTEVVNNCFMIAPDQSGCCILQQCVEYSTVEIRERLMDEISANVPYLSEDRYGNYVVQRLLERKISQIIKKVVRQLEGHYLVLSCDKYGSNVVEKFILDPTRQQVESVNFRSHIILGVCSIAQASFLASGSYSGEHPEAVIVAVVQKSLEFALCFSEKSEYKGDDFSIQNNMLQLLEIALVNGTNKLHDSLPSCSENSFSDLQAIVGGNSTTIEYDNYIMCGHQGASCSGEEKQVDRLLISLTAECLQPDQQLYGFRDRPFINELHKLVSLSQHWVVAHLVGIRRLVMLCTELVGLPDNLEEKTTNANFCIRQTFGLRILKLLKDLYREISYVENDASFVVAIASLAELLPSLFGIGFEFVNGSAADGSFDSVIKLLLEEYLGLVQVVFCNSYVYQNIQACILASILENLSSSIWRYRGSTIGMKLPLVYLPGSVLLILKLINDVKRQTDLTMGFEEFDLHGHFPACKARSEMVPLQKKHSAKELMKNKKMQFVRKMKHYL